ncbi:menaquinone biosynthetic enzyme MqnA/MqnD family protein [Leptospira sp. 'Mane']|uniref:menaquinone biosynthetic enzyme MqnA/MqnD family protein n=1 Tax=Leptospira sp. 'Mane' TaxID=3387407 RepID=UPI00398B2F7A
MKIGIVKHLNARPLTYYFENHPDYEIISDNPSFLVEELKVGRLDCALISSIECERNRLNFSYSKSVGVCARDVVRSILYFENKNEQSPPKEIHTDSGSRSSVALLQCIFHLVYGFTPKVIPTEAKEINSSMEKNQGSHLLFGDHALLHNAPEDYQIYDLASWWNQITKTNFCFAFWAFPKDKPIEDSFFTNALEYGLDHIEEIIHKEKRLPTAIVDRYLRKELHYYPDQLNLDGFQLYIDTCKKIGILN